MKRNVRNVGASRWPALACAPCTHQIPTTPTPSAATATLPAPPAAPSSSEHLQHSTQASRNTAHSHLLAWAGCHTLRKLRAGRVGLSPSGALLGRFGPRSSPSLSHPGPSGGPQRLKELRRAGRQPSCHPSAAELVLRGEDGEKQRKRSRTWGGKGPREHKSRVQEITPNQQYYP